MYDHPCEFTGGDAGHRIKSVAETSKEGCRITKTPDTKKRRGFRQDFRHSFLRGLGALAPTLLTTIILVWLYQFIDKNIASHINKANVWLLSRVTNHPTDRSEEIDRIRQQLGDTGLTSQEHRRLLDEKRALFQRTRDAYDARVRQSSANDPQARKLYAENDRVYRELLSLLSQRGRMVSYEEARQAWWQELYSDWPVLQFTGFIVAVILVYFAGFFFATYLGRGVWRLLEAAMKRIPVVKQIYPYIKQITDFVLSEQKVEFRRVVAVQYPRRGVWSMGFVTGSGLRTVREATGLHMVTVFIPSSPTPVTGYVVLVRREDIIDLPIGVDSALRFAISGGVIMPPGEVPPQLDVPVVIDADPETVTTEPFPPRRPPPPAETKKETGGSSPKKKSSKRRTARKDDQKPS